jgi:hypothetical protein
VKRIPSAFREESPAEDRVGAVECAHFAGGARLHPSMINRGLVSIFDSFALLIMTPYFSAPAIDRDAPRRLTKSHLVQDLAPNRRFRPSS